jgi:hypothetical protein
MVVDDGQPPSRARPGQRPTTGPRPASPPPLTAAPSAAAPATAADPGRWGGLLEQLSTVAGVVAPTTVVTALLYYYGYVATYARFAYFGVDLATLRLPTQDLVLRSVAVLYIPCAVILVLGIAYLVVRNRTRTALSTGAHRPVLRWIGWTAVRLGVVLLARAAYGIVVPSVPRTEFPGTTPLALGAGVVLLLYGRHLLGSTREDRADSPPQRPVLLLAVGVVVLSLFWGANTFAAAYGAGQAEEDSADLASRPSVTLDTRESLYLNEACAEETSLPPDAEQAFRYRLRGLRLLAVGSDRLFLIPERWRDGCPVVVVPDDESVRLQVGP